MTLGRSKIRMVVSDLDGTFLDNDSLISEANRLAVKALQDQVFVSYLPLDEHI